MLKRFFPLILSSLLLALALPCNAQNKLTNPFLPSPANVGQTVAVNVPALPQPFSERLACYSLSYARVKDVQEALTPHFGTKLGLDTITNSLILLGDEQSHARLRQLLPKLDVATRQVTLEAKSSPSAARTVKTWAYAGIGTLFPNASRKQTTVTVTAAIMTATLNSGVGLPFASTLRLMLSSATVKRAFWQHRASSPSPARRPAFSSVTTFPCRQKSMTAAAVIRQRNILMPASSCNMRLSSAKTVKW